LPSFSAGAIVPSGGGARSTPAVQIAERPFGAGRRDAAGGGNLARTSGELSVPREDLGALESEIEVRPARG
jgi:hypothetical protein